MSTTCGGAVVVIKQMCMIYVWALPRQVEAAVADEHTDTRRALKSLKLSLEQVRANPFSALTGEVVGGHGSHKGWPLEAGRPRERLPHHRAQAGALRAAVAPEDDG
eukprot:4583499-Pyramimonas_sp.AAC.1